MGVENIDKIYKLLDNIPMTPENSKIVKEVRKCLQNGDFTIALQKIRLIDMSAKVEETATKKKRGRKKKEEVKVEEIKETEEQQEEKIEEKIEEKKEEKNQPNNADDEFDDFVEYEDGFVIKEENETQEQFVQRLTKISSEFNSVIKATNWASEQLSNSIYFINITDHTNDELKKVIMNYYYKERIEYVFYDTLKTDTANIGIGEELKKTATILSNLAQNFDMFICSTLQLEESSTLPVNLTVNDLAVSRTVKEVLDTLCLIKQINRENYEEYEYSVNEVDTKFFDLEKSKNPDVRHYACVVDKNRAGAKPRLVFRLNLAYNSWEELGYLRLKQRKEET